MATHSSILVCKNPMNRGAWQATVHKVAKSWTLSMQEYHHVLVNHFWPCLVFAASCGLSLVAMSGGLLFVVVTGLLIVVASPVADSKL